MKLQGKYCRFSRMVFAGLLLGLPAGGWAADDAPWGRNPFLTVEEAAGSAQASSEGLRVKAIIIGPPRSVVMLDGKTLFEGEKIGNETVKEILPNGVVLEGNGRKRFLPVHGSSVSISLGGKGK